MSNSDVFIRAIHQAEETRMPDSIAALFTGDSCLSRLNTDQVYAGIDGAQEFWSEYLSLFREIRSNFTNVIEAGETVVLEWEAVGHFSTGHRIEYPGVSIIEFDGDKVRRFRTYYDSAPFANNDSDTRENVRTDMKGSSNADR